MTIRTRYLVVAASIFIVGAYYFWYSSSTHTDHNKTLDLCTLTRRNLEQFVKASGTLKAKEQLVVGSLVGGRVLEWYADANNPVKKGQILAKIDDGIGYAGVEKALGLVEERTAELARAKQIFARISLLLESSAAPQDEYDKQRFAVDLAQARLVQAKADLKMNELKYENLSIKSPDDGTVIARKIDVGQMVTAQLQATELFVIAKDLRHMEATIDVDEADIGLIRPGQEAFFVVDAFPTVEYKATVLRVENLAKSAGTVISYSVILNVENPDLTLRPGMTTNVQINVAKTTQALCIPQRCLRLAKNALEASAKLMNHALEPHQDTGKPSRTYQSYVWVKEGQKIKQVSVKIGVSDTEHAQIVSGITEQSQVVCGVNAGIKENSLLQRFGQKSPIGGK